MKPKLKDLIITLKDVGMSEIEARAFIFDVLTWFQNDIGKGNLFLLDNIELIKSLRKVDLNLILQEMNKRKR